MQMDEAHTGFLMQAIREGGWNQMSDPLGAVGSL